jgi:SAM-dependent methyltransferase
MSENTNDKPVVEPQDSPGVFADYARYYDLLYQDKDYAAEAEYVVNLIRKFEPSARSVLELGSGTGIHAALMAEKGFTVHGIERSSGMHARSQNLVEEKPELHGKLTFEKGDIRDVRIDKHFDVVISLFHVISYQATNEDVIAAFETARHHMDHNGIFIFDVWYGPAVLTERPTVRIKRMSNEQIEITRLAEPVLHPNENLVDVNYHIFVRERATGDVRELKETHVMRYFFKPEIESIASRTGFEIVNAEEWQSGKSIGAETWGVCFILKAV